jgi:hypothetical protein
VAGAGEAAEILFLTSRALHSGYKLTMKIPVKHLSNKGLVARKYKELFQLNKKTKTIQLKISKDAGCQ